MLTTELVISIPGEPYTKGSLRCIGARGKIKHQLVEQLGKPAQDWRETVAYWVRRRWMTHMADKGQPLGAELTFTLPRPKGHYGTGRNADLVKPTAPPHPVGHGTGDIDKLTRLILDALQDTHVLPDDCAIVELNARKVWPRTSDERWDDVLGYPGVVIRLYPIEDT